MDDIIEEICRLQGERAALASLVWSSGSIPMSDRAKMLVTENGRVLGTIGGGCLEAELLATCGEVIDANAAHMTKYTMTETQAGENGLNCGGTVRIYTEPIANVGTWEIYDQLHTSMAKRRVCVMATMVGQVLAGTVPSRKMLAYDNGESFGTLGTASADSQIHQTVARVIAKEGGVLIGLELEPDEMDQMGLAGGRAEVFVEPFVPPPQLLVFGGGHVGGEICRLAKSVGFEVIVIDDRPMFANVNRHPLADRCMAAEVDNVFTAIQIDEQSYIVAATRGHQHDEQVVRQAVRTPARYIGMLGSERKKMLMWKKLEQEGGSRSRLDQVFAPIGLNIGADTPEEIAVSVVAELIRVRRGVRKRWKTKVSDPQESGVAAKAAADGNN
jgi:xanthine dehydrogenase accessory factor